MKKNNYNPWPVNNERIGTLQYDDYFSYEHKFYHDKSFHEDRIKRGVEVRKGDILRGVAFTAAAGVLAAGALIHGGHAISAIFNSSTASSIHFGVDFIASLISGEVSYYLVKDAAMPEFRHASNVKKDIEASKIMVRSLSK